MRGHNQWWGLGVCVLLLMGCGTNTGSPTAAPTRQASPTAMIPTAAPTPTAGRFPAGYLIVVTVDPPSGPAPLTVRLHATITSPANRGNTSTNTSTSCYFPEELYDFGEGPVYSPRSECAGVPAYGSMTPIPPTPTPDPSPMITMYVSEPYTYRRPGTYHAAFTLRWNGQDLRGETVVQVQ